MEQITSHDGVFYYGGQRCDDIEDLYQRFRRDYHDSIGRKAFRRLDRLGQRKERVHGFGFVFGDREGMVYGQQPRRECFLLGLVNVSYCWIVGLSDVRDESVDAYVDRLFEKGSGMLKFIGKRSGLGRTSKLLKKRYR